MSAAGHRFAKNNDTRALVWSHLVIHPGLTAQQIGQGALRRSKGVIELCRRMEADGQLFSNPEFVSQQGRNILKWYATPGAFPVGGAP